MVNYSISNIIVLGYHSLSLSQRHIPDWSRYNVMLLFLWNELVIHILCCCDIYCYNLHLDIILFCVCSVLYLLQHILKHFYSLLINVSNHHGANLCYSWYTQWAWKKWPPFTHIFQTDFLEIHVCSLFSDFLFLPPALRAAGSLSYRSGGRADGWFHTLRNLITLQVQWNYLDL